MMVWKCMALVAALTAALALTAGCRGKDGKYADIKAHMAEVIAANESYVNSLEKAANAKDVAQAINELSGKMEVLTRRQEELEKTYPELKTIDRNNPPVDLKEQYERLNALGERKITASIKIMKYMIDPEVMKASQELARKTGKTNITK